MTNPFSRTEFTNNTSGRHSTLGSSAASRLLESSGVGTTSVSNPPSVERRQIVPPRAANPLGSDPRGGYPRNFGPPITSYEPPRPVSSGDATPDFSDPGRPAIGPRNRVSVSPDFSDPGRPAIGPRNRVSVSPDFSDPGRPSGVPGTVRGDGSGSAGIGGTDTASPSINDSEIYGGVVDHRIRIRPKFAQTGQIYGNGVMSILRQTNGMVFPYTPQISNFARSIRYTDMSNVHANQDFYSYASTPSLKLTITGTFTAQNDEQGRYTYACIHFLSTISQMRFGETDQRRGFPPPLMLLSGYGNMMFNDLPVLLEQYNIDMLTESDLVEINLGPGDRSTSFPDVLNNSSLSSIISQQNITNGNAGTVWLPNKLTISTTWIVQNSPARLRKEFNWERFRDGSLLLNKGWR